MADQNNTGDVLSVLGGAVFGNSGFGLFLATYKAIRTSFAKMHPRYLTPTVASATAR